MNRMHRMCVLLIETGVLTMILTVLAVNLEYGTWLWYATKGGNRIAWLIPPTVALAFWLAVREERAAIKRFAIGFHVLYAVLVTVVLILYYTSPLPD